MRKKRFMAFLLSLAMAGTSVYTCGVIDVQAAAIENQEAENPNLEQLADEIQAQAADMTDNEMVNPISEQFDEPEAQAAAGAISLNNVVNGEAEWGRAVKFNNTGQTATSIKYMIDGKVVGTDINNGYTASSGDIGKTITVSVDNYDPASYTVTKRTISEGMVKYQKSQQLAYTAGEQTIPVTVSDDEIGYVLPEKGAYITEFTNNVRPGKANLVVTVMNSATHQGEVSIAEIFEVTQREVTSVNIAVTSELQKTMEYTGKQLVPEVTVTDRTSGLTIGEGEYQITWSNNISVNDIPVAAVTFPSGSPFKGGSNSSPTSIAGVFSITPRNAAFTTSFKDNKDAKFIYGTTLDAVKKNLVVSDGSLSVSTTDYSVELEKAPANGSLSIGDYTLNITGSGNYAPTSKGTAGFSIVPEGISANDIYVKVLSEDKISYNGQEQKPKLDVSVNVTSENGTDKKSVTLEEGTDYDVSFINNKNAGISTNANAPTAIVTVKAKDYTEVPVEKRVSFNILPASISSSNVSATKKADPVYVGGPQKPEVTISANFSNNVKETLVEGVDYIISADSYKNNISASETNYECKVVASGNYSGDIKVSYNIAKRDISGNGVEWTLQREYGYTGKQIRPKFDVRFTASVSSDKLLSENRDYSVSYGDNISMNTGGSVTVTGSGNFCGVETKKFAIGGRKITDVKAETVKYAGSPISADDYVHVKSDDDTLRIKNDYLLIYEDGKLPVDAGTYTITVSGTNDYFNQNKEVEFKILPRDFVSGNVSVNCGKGHTFKTVSDNWDRPEITISDNGTKKYLAEGKDYTTDITRDSADKTKGHYVITAVDGGNYTGSISGNFEITKSDLSETKIEATSNGDKFVYTGKAIRPLIDQFTVVDASHDNVVLSSGDIYIMGYSNNISAGNASVRFGAWDDSDYENDCWVPFTIDPKDITDETEVIMLSSNEKTISGMFTGDDVTLSADDLKTECLSYNGEVLSTNDYDVIFKKDGKVRTTYYEAGDYDIIAKGKGNYAGERKVGTYKVMPIELDITKFSLSPSENTYTGEPLTTDVEFEKRYYNEDDFTVVYPEDMTTKGLKEIVIKGQGNYTGENTLYFRIKGLQLTKENTTVTYAGVSENGDVQIDVRTEGKRLTSDDYTYTALSVSGADPAAWEIAVTATAGSNYEGTVISRVEAGAIVLENEDVQVLTDLTYNAKEHVLSNSDIQVVKGGKVLSENTDYTVIGDAQAATNVGETATLTVSGMGEYTGTAIAQGEIQPLALTEGCATLAKDAVYTGHPAAPEVTVTMLDNTLKEGADYEVVADERVEVGGPYTATVKGLGNYTGSTTVSYNITAATLENATVEVEPLTYTGKAQAPSKADVKVMVGDQILTADQYEIECPEDAVNVGEYEFKIIGKGIYEGTVATGKYQIVAASFVDDAKAVAKSVVYTGAKAEPQVTVTIGDLTLKEGTDYVVDAGNAVDAKKGYALSVIGIGNYAGTIETTFDINPKTITKSNVKVTVPSATYNGKAQTPKSASVAVDNRVLAAKDFSFAGAKNAVNAGKVNVTITGKGNYTGTVTGAWFTINPKDLSKGKVSGIVNKIYTGKALKQSVAVTVDGKKLTAAAKTFKVTYKNNKNIGPATLTIDGQGNYKGHISSRSFKIFPAKATIKSLKAGKSRFTVQTKKLGGGVKYQIQYRLKGSKAGYTRIETNNLKKVIKGLKKGKTYTVKVRAYKKVSKKIYYGAFSKAKNVKIKK